MCKAVEDRPRRDVVSDRGTGLAQGTRTAGTTWNCTWRTAEMSLPSRERASAIQHVAAGCDFGQGTRVV